MAIDYATRADFVSDVGNLGSLSNGDIVRAGDLFYEKDSASFGQNQKIADLPQFVPAGEFVTPQHFNAKGDNVTNDSPAFLEMFTWVMGGGGNWREIYLPAGLYVIESRIEMYNDPHNFSEKFALSIRGSGPSSVIVNRNSDGFFLWNMSNPIVVPPQPQLPRARDTRTYMHDFSVEMDAGGNNGQIITIKQIEGGISRQEDALIENIWIFPKIIPGQDPNDPNYQPPIDYYTTGIVLKGMYWPTIVGCQIANPYGPKVSTGDQHQGTAGINVNDSYGPQIIRTKVWGAAKGITYRQENPEDFEGPEGGLIDYCVFDSKVGIYIESNGTEPGLEIVRTHCNCAEKGIHIVRKKLVNIGDCLLYG